MKGVWHFGMCVPCHESCLTCNVDLMCTTCYQGRITSNGICVSYSGWKLSGIILSIVLAVEICIITAYIVYMCHERRRFNLSVSHVIDAPINS